MQIPFCDLSRALNPIRSDIDRAISKVVSSGWFLRGKETALFEEEWAEYCGQSYAVSCNSGTDALTLAALALNLSTATIQANTLPLTGIGLHKAGVKVKLSDIDKDGYLPKSVASDAVPVLLFGRLPRNNEKPATLYDAAHAHGWKPIGTAAFSFYPTKTLGGLGDGGAITTNDKNLANEMRMLSGRDDALYDKRQLTSRMDEIQAAVLRVKLKHLDQWLYDRKQIAAYYEVRLGKRELIIPGESLQHLFVIKTGNRQGLVKALSEAGIETKVHWGDSLNSIDGPWNSSGQFPESDRWSKAVLSLPCYPGIKKDELSFICDTIEAWHELNLLHIPFGRSTK
jgi:dTDP-4-amino-4,6-dideoxygalactose transaminase